MNTTLDHISVGLLVFGALLFFANRFRRKRKGKACGGDCCSAAEPSTHFPKQTRLR